MNTKSPSDFLKAEVLKGLCLGLAFALLIPFVTAIIWPTPIPTFNANTQAYILIKKGLKEGRYSTAKELFDQAYSMTDDSELRYLADFFSKDCQIALDAGVATHEEEDSLEGGIKAMVAGFTQPLVSLSSWSQLAKEWFGDFNDDCTIVDQRYLPIIQAYISAEEANENASHFSWWWFCGTPIAFGINALYKIGTKSERAN